MCGNILLSRFSARFDSNIRQYVDAILIILVAPFVLPILLIISIVIFLDSGLPLLYAQERIGRNNQIFQILKFRTMFVTQNIGPLITSSKDKRITRSGKFLRKWKLDELPQFVNVLRNEMSLVGPRPEVEHYVSKWPIDIRGEILKIKPGLVDPFTLQMIQEEIHLGKVENPEEYYLNELLPQKLNHYMVYMENRTFIGDYWFLIKAFFITFSPRKLRRNTDIN